MGQGFHYRLKSSKRRSSISSTENEAYQNDEKTVLDEGGKKIRKHKQSDGSRELGNRRKNDGGNNKELLTLIGEPQDQITTTGTNATD